MVCLGIQGHTPGAAHVSSVSIKTAHTKKFGVII
jgi:hypothetical protein